MSGNTLKSGGQGQTLGVISVILGHHAGFGLVR
ncbi:MAG: hypothetical protein M2R46_03422 [Verrucomicrobia subdivision 3 bacterium]|nr:hypothetical protein [Limisphaerales bacterium]